MNDSIARVLGLTPIILIECDEDHEALSGKCRGPFTGYRHTKEAREKISLSLIGKPGRNTGKVHNEQARMKIRIARIGGKGHFKNKTHSEKSKVLMSESKRGVSKPSFTDEHKLHMSISARERGIPQAECPHCGKVGNKAVMYRWHFNNCKNA